MPLSGEYPTPALRDTNLRIPTTVGYTTGRLRAQLDFLPLLSLVENQVFANITNTGTATTVIQFVSTTDSSASGIRTNVGSAISLARGGNTSVNFSVTQNFLEVTCTGGSNSEVDIQLSSQVKFDDIGFSKADPFYPPQIWQANFNNTGV
jgi:hypothetical protein